jgi:hypothetical protein
MHGMTKNKFATIGFITAPSILEVHRCLAVKKHK